VAKSVFAFIHWHVLLWYVVCGSSWKSSVCVVCSCMLYLFSSSQFSFPHRGKHQDDISHSRPPCLRTRGWCVRVPAHGSVQTISSNFLNMGISSDTDHPDTTTTSQSIANDFTTLNSGKNVNSTVPGQDSTLRPSGLQLKNKPYRKIKTRTVHMQKNHFRPITHAVEGSPELT